MGAAPSGEGSSAGDNPPEGAVGRNRSDDAKKKRGLSFWLELPVLFIVALAIAMLVKAFVFQVFRIPSGSMLPTLEIGDRVLVNKLTYSPENLHRGDIIVFIDPNERGKPDDRGVLGKVKDGIVEGLGGEGHYRHLIKRIVGCPGQTVQGVAGRVLVDGKPIDEPYLPAGMHTDWSESRTLGPEEFFVMGDNRGNSSDSRVFGPIKSSEIVGRAAVRIWPPSRWGGLPGGQGTC